MLGILIYAALATVSFDFTIDDTFISMRYADNLARFGELVWNQGETVKVEGYSNLLWVLLLTSLYRFCPGEPLLVAKLLSAVFGGATLVVFSLLASQLLRSRTLVVCGTVLLAISRPLLVWGCSGMETTLYTFLVCLVLYLLLLEDRGDLSFAVPVVLFLICLTRTEGVVFFGAAVTVRIIRRVFLNDRRYNWTNRKWILWNAIFLLLVGTWLTWKFVYYGSIIPLPAYVKNTAGFAGYNYVKAFVSSLRLFIPLAVIGIFWGKRRIGQQTVTVALLVYVTALSAANPTIMGMEYRLVIAALPMIYLLAMLGLDRIVEYQSRWPAPVVAIVVCTFLVFRSVGNPWSYPERLDSVAGHYSRTLVNVHIPLGMWLAENIPVGTEARVALCDAGATAFHARCHIIDFYGLNDVEFARYPMTPDRLLQREPDFIVLKSKSVERFEGSDSNYGRMSDMIYAAHRFQSDYRVKNIWSSSSPFYCLWLFERLPAQILPVKDALRDKTLKN